MPYVNQKIRDLHADTIEHFEALHAGHITAGELNYLLTSLCHSVLKQQRLNYGNANMIMGVLAGVRAELYRTVIAPYEDRKRLENGVVSELDGSWQEKLR